MALTRHRVAALDDLEPGSVHRVDPGGVPVCLVRVEDGGVYAMSAICSHQDIDLSYGDIDEFALTCPAHASCFDVRTGEPDGPPAKDPVRIYPVDVADGEVFIEIGE